VAQIEVTITTPEGVELRQQVDELTAPSVQGEFGVLPGHLPLLAGLKTGVVRLVSGGEASHVAVGPGFVQVTDDGRARIITERFKRKAEVDAVVCRKELKEAEDRVDALGSTGKQEDLYAAIAKARWAAVCLELYGDPPPATLMMDLETKLVAYEDYLHQLTSAQLIAASEDAGSDRGGEAHA
jgi:F-type H+-transporting ATPase subunit epsilon